MNNLWEIKCNFTNFHFTMTFHITVSQPYISFMLWKCIKNKVPGICCLMAYLFENFEFWEFRKTLKWQDYLLISPIFSFQNNIQTNISKISDIVLKNNFYFQNVLPSETLVPKNQIGSCIKKCPDQTFQNWNMALCQAVGCNNTTCKNKVKNFMACSNVHLFWSVQAKVLWCQLETLSCFIRTNLYSGIYWRVQCLPYFLIKTTSKKIGI